MADFTPYRKAIIVEAADCGSAGRMSAAAMTYHLQEAAAAHAEALDVGIPRLRKLGALWVVTRMGLEISRQPEQGETVYVETWPGKTRHVLFPRYYAITAENGETLARGAGVWMLIHPESRKMLFPEEIGLVLPDMSRGDEPALPDRRVRFPAELGGSGHHEVVESELDVNGHVNNVHYLRWAESLLPEGFAESHRLWSVWVEYRKEILLGQSVALHHAIEGDALFVQGTVEGDEHYRLRFGYEGT
ncbi:MAG: hypothetical protein IJE26_05540 [Oscillospiraceae bacterium]|nr:hypothetical protein [Oscillospiraceae bacterium]